MQLTAYANKSLVSVYQGPERVAFSIPEGDEMTAPAEWCDYYHGVNLEEADWRLEEELGYVAGEWAWDEDRGLFAASVSKL